MYFVKSKIVLDEGNSYVLRGENSSFKGIKHVRDIRFYKFAMNSFVRADELTSILFTN